ncbi:MAG: flagellar hook-length control protein FliK [Planctomycetota bacterium]|nr:flagellar hook-length control protein FliK [Planctomycetota bacterium]
MTNILFPELSTGQLATREYASTRSRADQDGAQLSFADFLRMMGALPALEVTAETAAIAATQASPPRAVNIEGLQTMQAQSAMWLEDGFRELLNIAYGEQPSIESTGTIDPILGSPYMARLFTEANAGEARLIPIPATTFTDESVRPDGTDWLTRGETREANELPQPTGAYPAFLTGEAKTEAWTQFRLSSPDVDPLLLGRNPYVVEQMSDPIVNWAQLNKNGEQTEFHVRLDPPELGAVRLVINTSDDAISVQLVTASDATRDVMQSHLADLVQALESAGLNLDACDVTCDESFAHADPPVPVDPFEPRSQFALTRAFGEFLDSPNVLSEDRVDMVV